MTSMTRPTVLLVFVICALACSGRRSLGPGRECAVAQPVCAGAACACSAESACTDLPARPKCASDVTSTCCDGQCRFGPGDAVRCPCIVGEIRTCGVAGVETCVDANPGSINADDESAAWGPCREIDGGSPVETEAGVPALLDWYRDADGDGFCGQHTSATTSPGADWVTSCPSEPSACEGNPAVHLSSAEVCGNGVDDDCVGGDLACPPPPTVTYYQDPDGDGYCGVAQGFTSNPGAPWTATCRTEPASCENDAARNPGKAEICGNGVDDDCKNGDKACPPRECPATKPVKCECNDGFVSDCITRNMCNNHHPHCGIGNQGVPRTEGCGCEAR